MNSNPILQPEIECLLAVSILLPVVHSGHLEEKLKALQQKTEEKLLSHFPEDKVSVVMSRLTNTISHADYKTHKRGIAIFVSSISEKIYYLEAEVQEKIDIEEFFEVKDELFRKKMPHNSCYHYIH